MSKNQLPMAINPSVNYNNNFQLIEIPNLGQHPFLDHFVIEVNTQTIGEGIAVFLGIGYDECIGYIGENNFTHCQFPRDGFHGHHMRYKGITLNQLRGLFDIAKQKKDTKFIPILSELILTQVLPLFNQPQLLIEDSDFNQEATPMTTKQLINIKPQTIGNETINSVSARELYRFLESKREFTNWVKPYIKAENDYGFIEGVDYIAVDVGVNRVNQCVMKDYWFTVDMAKEVSMLSKTAKGKEARKYFIECEKKATAPQISQAPIATISPAPTIKVNAAFLKLALKQIDEMKLSPDSKQVLKAQLLHDHAGLSLELMLPVTTEQKLSPTQIAERLKVSPQAIGRIISLLGFRGKDDYCEGRLGKAKKGSKEIVLYFYTEQAVQLIQQTLKEKQQHEKTN